MDLITAHELLARGLVADPGLASRLLPEECEPVDIGDGCDTTPAVLVGMALLSGQLENASTFDEAVAAVEHGASLLVAGIISGDELNAAAVETITAIIRWGDEMAFALGGPEAN